MKGIQLILVTILTIGVTVQEDYINPEGHDLKDYAKERAERYRQVQVESYVKEDSDKIDLSSQGVSKVFKSLSNNRNLIKQKTILYNHEEKGKFNN